MEIFRRKITKDQCKDAGMAFTLVCILLGFVYRRDYLLIAAICLLIINMTAPMTYKALGRVWFGLAEVMGTITSQIILSLVFFVVVTPVATIRRIMHKDSLKLYEFKKSGESVMVVRNQTFGARDIEKPF